MTEWALRKMPTIIRCRFLKIRSSRKLRSLSQIHDMITEAEKEMLAAAEKLDFERAAMFRDKIKKLKEHEIGILQ